MSPLPDYDTGLDGYEYPISSDHFPRGYVLAKLQALCIMTTVKGFLPGSIKEAKAEASDSYLSTAKSYIKERYVKATGREFDLTLSPEGLKHDMLKELDQHIPLKAINEALVQLDFYVRSIGDKRICYARRVRVL